jgi:hypothetical protein
LDRVGGASGEMGRLLGSRNYSDENLLPKRISFSTLGCVIKFISLSHAIHSDLVRNAKISVSFIGHLLRPFDMSAGICHQTNFLNQEFRDHASPGMGEGE